MSLFLYFQYFLLTIFVEGTFPCVLGVRSSLRNESFPGPAPVFVDRRAVTGMRASKATDPYASVGAVY